MRTLARPVNARGRGATVRFVAPVVAVRRAAAGRVARDAGIRVTAARGSMRVATVGRAELRGPGRSARPGRRDGPCPLGVRRCVIPAPRRNSPDHGAAAFAQNLCPEMRKPQLHDLTATDYAER